MMRWREALLCCVAACTAVTAVTDARVSSDPATIRRLDGTTITPAQVDNAVAAAMKRGSVPGLGLAIINNGAVVYEKGYGLRDVEQKLPFTVDTNTYAASLTKVVVGYTALQLVDQGVIALDTPIADYLPKPLPDYEKYDGLKDDERWRKFTPRILMSHTSGLGNWYGDEPDKKLKIHFDPGTRYAYSGEGLNLLAMVIETVTKEPFEATVRREVFEPFGMATTEMTYQPRLIRTTRLDTTKAANGSDRTSTSTFAQPDRCTRRRGIMRDS